MSGTREGGVKAAQTNKDRYGGNFYNNIGQIGGKKSKGGQFQKDKEAARYWGSIGGKKSRRGA